MTELMPVATYWIPPWGAFHAPGVFLYENHSDRAVRVTVETQRETEPVWEMEDCYD